MKKISKQVKWQHKQKKLGNCTICGKPSSGKTLCPAHSIKHRLYYRNKCKYNPKQLDKPGRPIVYE